MTSMATRSDAPENGGRTRQELVATVLLVVAALGTSWSSYQATRWNGEQAAAAGRTNAIRIEAARADGLSRSQTQVDVATFIAWADADIRGEEDVADFYEDRFREEFVPAFDAWSALEPLSNPEAPPTPFAMEEYQVAAQEEADKLDAAAEASAAEVRLDILRSSNYVLTVVLYAVVLFFAGMSTRLHNPRLRWVMTVRRLRGAARHVRLDRDLPDQPRGLSTGEVIRARVMRAVARCRTVAPMTSTQHPRILVSLGVALATVMLLVGLRRLRRLRRREQLPATRRARPARPRPRRRGRGRGLHGRGRPAVLGPVPREDRAAAGRSQRPGGLARRREDLAGDRRELRGGDPEAGRRGGQDRLRGSGDGHGRRDRRQLQGARPGDRHRAPGPRHRHAAPSPPR